MEKRKKKFKGFGTSCVHSATSLGKGVPSHNEPIYPTTAFAYDSPDELIEIFAGTKEGYIYSRWNNPNFEMAETKIAALEAFDLKDDSGNDLQLKAKLFGSGMGAISALMFANLKAGDSVIAQGTLYGGTSELLSKVLAPLNIKSRIIELKSLELVENICKKDSSVRLIYIETPANPTIDCYDIEALTKIAKRYNVITAVDNTFATPYLQQPFKYGVDYVLHSTTKFLNGHGNATGGVLVSKDKEFMNTRMQDVAKLVGANSNPFEAWLLTQGMKTLELRMDRHCSNALQLAEFLSNHKAVSKANYCGLPSHPDYKVAKHQMKKFGGMLSFELKDGLEAGKKFIRNLTVSTLAVSLGTIDTIVQHPASMSHLKVAKETREKFGITDGLIRVSVGIENIEDLLNDFEGALLA